MSTRGTTSSFRDFRSFERLVPRFLAMYLYLFPSFSFLFHLPLAPGLWTCVGGIKKGVFVPSHCTCVGYLCDLICTSPEEMMLPQTRLFVGDRYGVFWQVFLVQIATEVLTKNK